MFVLENVKYKNIIDVENLVINKNDITCITGKSGSGKSTLLKLLNKLISPDDGKIFYKNTDIEDIDSVEYRRQIPMLSQFPIIFDGNVRDNLLIGLKFSENKEKDDKELEDILKKVHLDKSLEDDPKNMSGGEKQRLSIARIMLMDTDVILLDEPSSALDSKTEYEIIKLLRQIIKDNNKSMIFVTHSLEIADNFSDRIINLDAGKVINIKEKR